MAYKPLNLSVLAYANGFTVWHYHNSDDEITVNYFSDGDDMIRQGDLINANMVDGLYALEAYKEPEDDTLKVRSVKLLGQ